MEHDEGLIGVFNLPVIVGPFSTVTLISSVPTIPQKNLVVVKSPGSSYVIFALLHANSGTPDPMFPKNP